MWEVMLCYGVWCVFDVGRFYWRQVAQQFNKLSCLHVECVMFRFLNLYFPEFFSSSYFLTSKSSSALFTYTSYVLFILIIPKAFFGLFLHVVMLPKSQADEVRSVMVIRRPLAGSREHPLKPSYLHAR